MSRANVRGLVLCVALAAFGAGWNRASADDLFYNFYVGPSPNVGGVPAQLYVSPRPAPPLVGHTYITYQPMMPHEFLYQHHRTYYRYFPSGGYTRTKIHYW